MDVKFNSKFLPFFESEHRYAILIGGAGSGKSHAVGQKIISRCFNEKHRVLMVRKVKNTIEGSVFNLIKDLLRDMGALDNFVTANNTKMSFTFPNGSEIITTGLDDVEKLKSIAAVTLIWVEEITELDADDIKQLDLRLRGETPFYKQIMASFNPISEDHWLKKMFFDTPSDMVFTLHSTYKDNLFLDAQYIQMLNERYNDDPNLKRIYVDGEWGRIITGQEFYRFDFSTHVVPIKFNPDLPTHLSFDFNVNPYMPLSIWQMEFINERYKVRAVDEIIGYNPNNDTENICHMYLDKYPNSQCYIYGDASGRARTTSSKIHNYDIIEEVLSPCLSNYSMRVPRKNPLIAKRRMFLNKVLDGKYNIDVEISPICKLMIADLENVLESPDGGKWVQKAKDPTSRIAYEKYGHLSDTFDYLFCGAFETYFKESMG